MDPANGDSRPAHRLLADDLRADIAAGKLAPGDRLPSVRDLSQRHGVAPGTVQQALRALHAEGLVTSSPGRGTFVRTDLDAAAVAPPASLEALADAVAELRERVAALEAREASSDS